MGTLIAPPIQWKEQKAWNMQTGHALHPTLWVDDDCSGWLIRWRGIVVTVTCTFQPTPPVCLLDNDSSPPSDNPLLYLPGYAVQELPFHHGHTLPWRTVLMTVSSPLLIGPCAEATPSDADSGSRRG